jgi:hypothetical protein
MICNLQPGLTFQNLNIPNVRKQCLYHNKTVDLIFRVTVHNFIIEHELSLDVCRYLCTLYMGCVSLGDL